MENTNPRKRILFLAANPKDTVPLRLEEEIREIDAGLRRASNRDNFHLLQKWALRPRDLRQAMLDVKPHIVHFSGHGSLCGGLVLEDAMGQSKLIEPVALAGLFSLFSEDIECVLLNACYSEAQAEAINDHIKYVIGMNDAIGDQASIEFAIGFYDALGGGESVETAFKFGCNAIQLEGLDDDRVPVLKSTPSESASCRIEPEAPKKWLLVLSATIDEVDKDKAEAIIEHLRQLSQDTSLTLRAKKSGSVRLIIVSSSAGFDKINTLIRENKLTQIAGLRIEEIREYDDQLAMDIPLTDQVERSEINRRTIQDIEFSNIIALDFQEDLTLACQKVFDRYQQSTFATWEDLRQEFLVRYGRWLPKYEKTANRKGVFYKIALNLLIDAQRHEAARRRRSEEVELKQIEWNSVLDTETHSNEEQIFLNECRKQLSEEEQSLFDEFIQGRSLREFAAAHNQSPKTISERWANIIETLSQFVSDNKRMKEISNDAADVSNLLTFDVTVRNGDLAA